MATLTIIDGEDVRLVTTSSSPPTAPALVSGGGGFAAPGNSLFQPPNAEQIVSAAPTPGGGVALNEAGRLPLTAPTTALIILTSDPPDVQNSQIWIRSDLNELRWREGGVTYKVAGTAV